MKNQINPNDNVDKTVFLEYAELVAKCKNGDENAFVELYNKSERMVYAVCFGILNNEDDAFDAMQETYLTVYKKINDLSDNLTFVRWIKKIASSKALNVYNKKKHNVSYDDTVATDESLQLDDDLESVPDYYIMDKTRREALEKILRETLSDVQYQTIHMYYYGELSVETIADMMNCPVGTVKTRLMKSRAKIKEGVKKYENENKDAFAGVPAVPFLTRFFNASTENLQVPSIDISSLISNNILNATKTTVAKETAKAVASSSVKAGFLTTTVGKIIATVVTLTVIGAVAITAKVINDDKRVVIEPTEKIIESSDIVLTEVSNNNIIDVVDVNVLNMNGHSYACYYGCETWEDASDICNSLGGYMAVINSQEENDALFAFVTSQGYDNTYIGYSDSVTEGVWEWVNGETSLYTNWNIGEPNGFTNSENYAVFSADGTWNDGDFTPRIENGLVCFICEWDYYVTGLTNITPELLESETNIDTTLTFDRDNVIVDTVVYTTLDFEPYEHHIPQINLDTEDANTINNIIMDDYNSDSYTNIDYVVLWANDEVFSLVIDYSIWGYDGYYRAYTFNASTGHWLTNSEILELADMDETTFCDRAFTVTADYLNANPMPSGDIPVIINGGINPAWVDSLSFESYGNYDMNQFYIDMVNNCINVSPDMDMFINQNGHIMIWRCIWPVADAHDSDTFFDVVTGEPYYSVDNIVN